MIGDRPAAAVDALSAAAGAEPGRADLWAELATALVAAGQASEAWDAAVRAVELAPRSAASHRAIGALGDSAQAESAYRHALLLDPAAFGGARPSASEPGAVSGGRHASGGAGGLAAWMASQVAGPDPASRPAGGRRRAPDPDAAAPAGRANGSRHAAADEDGPASGRHGVPEPSAGVAAGPPEVDPEWPVAAPPATGGRRRAPEDSEPAPAAAPSSGGRRRAREDAPAVWPGAGTAPAPDGGPVAAVWPGTAPDGGPATAVWAGTAPGPDGGPATAVWPGAGTVPGPDGGPGVWPAAGSAAAGEVQRGTAVGLPAWLGPSAATRGRDRARVPPGATRVVDPSAWRRGLITVVRIEWLVGVVCFLGLAYARTAPYTAGLLAGALVVAGAYGRLRWQGSILRTLRRPPEPARIPTYAAVAAVATAVVIIPAAMVGALTLARLAAVAAVTCATVAAVLLARTAGRDIRP